MIVPQMQQRWTGYSSEGSRSLLDGVLGARQASVNERQANVAERGQDLRDKYYDDQIAVRKAKAKLKKGQDRYADFRKKRDAVRAKQRKDTFTAITDPQEILSRKITAAEGGRVGFKKND